jgi:transposase InsO family protein
MRWRISYKCPGWPAAELKVQQAGDKYANLKGRIRNLFDLPKGRYGYRRITAALRREGEKINHNTIQRLMRDLHLKSCVRPKKYKSFTGNGPRNKPILHSDQRWQYRMPIYSRLLKKAKVRPSMSRKGNCLDNATMESFGVLLSAEVSMCRRPASRATAKYCYCQRV